MGGFFSPDGANAVLARPTDVNPALAQGWCRDVSHPGAGNGTRITATLMNQIIANLRAIVTGLGGEADGSDEMLLSALLAGLLAKDVYDPNAVAADAFAMVNMVESADAKVLTAAERAKLAYLAVSGAIDLDEIAARVVDLDAAVVLRGAWDASSGSFPGAGAAQAGDSWIVSVGGTVDGVAFSANDRVIAIADNASTTTFAANWFKADYSDLVTSIEGQTGALTLAAIGAAPLDSPALTGTPTAPTPTGGDSSTAIATTAYVQGALAAVALSPGDIIESYDESPKAANFVELDGSTITDGALDNPAVAARYPWMVSGDDLVLPDRRGRFDRVWAHGSANDPDRATRTARVGGQTGDYPGTNQADQLKAHEHNYQKPAAGAFGNPSGSSVNAGGLQTLSTTAGPSGAETRPINHCVSKWMLLG